MRSFLMTFALAALATTAACASSSPSQPVVAQTTTTSASVIDCGPELAGFDRIASAPLVILGELHGQTGSPAIAADLACREAQKSPTGATLALEVPEREQLLIDAYLSSDGGPAARTALLGGAFWNRKAQDGRSSAAMAGLLEKIRGWKAAGLPLRVAAIDTRTGPRNAEQALAGQLVSLVAEKHGPVVMLVGNLHARDTHMAGIARRDVPNLVALDERYSTGESWMCLTENANECGKKHVDGPGSGPWGTIDVFARPDDHGLNGTYSVGVAEASEPAVGVTTAQQTAALMAQFRGANRSRLESEPSESALSPQERTEWCRRVMPVAESRVMLEGDQFERTNVCDGILRPARDHQVVPEVKVKFDMSFFFARPTMSASYDRETRTLFLPLDATYEPWTDSVAVNHEWLHAKHHLNARNGFTLDSALMTYASGFTADEVPVVLCDVIHRSPNPERLERAEREVVKLRRQLDILATAKKKARQKHAGVVGTTFAASDGVDRWVGGKDPKKSLAVLEGVWRDAATALIALKASPPDVATATSVPLLAGDACDASK